MDRYFYFRDVADEIDDDDNSASVMVPVKNITGIAPGGSITTLNLYYKNVKNECTRGSSIHSGIRTSFVNAVTKA